jgi:hypothetical protein
MPFGRIYNVLITGLGPEKDMVSPYLKGVVPVLQLGFEIRDMGAHRARSHLLVSPDLLNEGLDRKLIL